MGELTPGYHVLAVNTHDAGTVTLNDVTMTYPSHGASLPWGIIVIIFVTAVVASLMTYADMGFRGPIA